jgi:hypothetical protein
MISKQTRVLLIVGIICLVSALIWQNYSHWAFQLTHRTVEVKTRPEEGSVQWDPNRMWIHHPAGSNFLLLVGVCGLLLTVPSLIGDIRRSRQHR